MAWTTSANPWGSLDLADAAERNRALGLNCLNSLKKVGIRGGLAIGVGELRAGRHGQKTQAETQSGQSTRFHHPNPRILAG